MHLSTGIPTQPIGGVGSGGVVVMLVEPPRHDSLAQDEGHTVLYIHMHTKPHPESNQTTLSRVHTPVASGLLSDVH